MPQDDPIANGPREWLDRACSALALAKLPRPAKALWEDQCFLAQQAAERAIKAVYLSKNLTFRYIHDLEELGKKLEDAGIPIPSIVKDAVVLTRYAVETRYPGPVEPVEEEEYQEAIRLSGAVVAWAEGIIDSPDTA